MELLMTEPLRFSQYVVLVLLMFIPVSCSDAPRVGVAERSCFLGSCYAPARNSNNETYEQVLTRARQSVSGEQPWIGLVGDSGITGAVTAENIQPRASSLLGWVASFAFSSDSTPDAKAERSEFARSMGWSGNLPPLTRIVYSQDEWNEARSKGSPRTLSLEARASLAVDIPEYSYGYLVGRALGMSPERIVLVAQDGKRVNAISTQMRRFRAVSPHLPSLIFVSFSANDICGEEATQPTRTFREHFKRQIMEQWQLVLRSERPHPQGTRVVIMAPLNVTSPLFDESLLSQEVQFQGGAKTTCREIRRQEAAQDALGRELQKGLTSMCRGLLSPTNDPEGLRRKIVELQAAQREVWQEVVRELPATQGWKFEYSDIPYNVRFQTGDLAHDCFHPGPGGHSRIAQELYPSMRN